ncbi:Uncharacterised protein [Serratia marcescens]|uniref:hypothetical protein n=1 Tax=Serratia marcescens TaxID=615 RepID=UPI00217B57BE|nr:hypothetical protein [Serratia marcescens]CAI0860095.1 Uncharacterised protein [Serratia marcescens]CAI0934734.1 Uncharacterised protein [Serratia marcescens]CAI1575587.1 Uncharacterised protein [Serratia marcescens]CAI1804399.1 Uncharacterised protein [Serratia marcescens]
MFLEEAKYRLLTANKTAEGLLTQIHDLYVQEIRSEEKVLIEALRELHNSGEIDLVEIMGGVDKNSRGYDFYTILLTFEEVLPSLDAKARDVLYCLMNLKQQAGRDLAFGGIYGAFERFCSMDICRSRDSIEYILKQSEIDFYAPFISSSILACGIDFMMEAIQRTENLIAHSNEVVRNQAYFILGRLQVDDNQAKIIWGLLSERAFNEDDNDCCASILRALLHFGDKFPSYWLQIEDLLATFVEGAPTEVLYIITHFVASQYVVLPESVQQLLIKQLGNVSPEHEGIINSIDYLLVRLVERGRSSIAVELLESILSAGVKFTSLDYFSNELLSKHQELRDHIITKWFLHGEASQCHGISDLLHNVTGDDIEINAETTLLDDEVKKIFVSHKAIGWLFTRPIAAASFILSISEIASKITLKELERVLYDPLLLSYPGELKRFFQSCIDKGVQEHLCRLLLEKLMAYHSEIEKVYELKELMAPSENVTTYWKDFDKGMQEAHEKASKSSLIGMFATHRLLYGNSSIYYQYQGGGKPVRQEMKMHSFSHSTEMPRLNVLDPESLDYILRVYRCEVMKNETNS